MDNKNQHFPKLGRFSGKKKASLRILMSSSEYETKSPELKTCILVLHSTVFPFHFIYIFQAYSFLSSVAVSTEVFFHTVALKDLKVSHVSAKTQKMPFSEVKH